MELAIINHHSIHIITFCLLGIVSCTTQQQPDDQLLRIPYKSTLDNMEKDYFLYLPRHYETTGEKLWPVLIFLHGDGERGNGRDDLDYVLIHGPLYEAWIQKRDLPFIIISPQLPMFGRDTISYLKDRKRNKIPQRLEKGTPERSELFSTSGPMTGALATDSLPYLVPPGGWQDCEKDILTIIEQVLSNYRVDKAKVYLTGLSYGGYGTWFIASKHPELFAAINPIVGWGHPDLMGPIAQHQLPVWAFSGGRDGSVETKYFFAGLNRLEQLGHTTVQFTIHEDMGHDVWKRVYAGEDIYLWFLSHSKN